jgi:hypothetical protein
MDMEPQRILKYLGLSSDYEPSPQLQPAAFLSIHLRELPADLLRQFSSLISPKQRSSMPAIRNRRFKFCDSDPEELSFRAASRAWPTLWDGERVRTGQYEGREERDWAEKEFMGGDIRPHVGKLGKLLGDFEEEREAERARSLRRAQPIPDCVPEEEESSDEDEDAPQQPVEPPEPKAEQVLFIRRIRERFIYGLLKVSHL